MAKKLYTIGHSTHSIAEFIELLQIYDINYLVDVRSIPQSRHVSWFNKTRLSSALKKYKIDYLHYPILGGLRHSSKDSINGAWQNDGFRGFADYMQTPEFFEGLKGLNKLIKDYKNVTIMCAEAVPWRCHRSLIADAEVIRGSSVLHIISKSSIKQHTLTAFAKIDRNKKPIKLYYPKGS